MITDVSLRLLYLIFSWLLSWLTRPPPRIGIQGTLGPASAPRTRPRSAITGPDPPPPTAPRCAPSNPPAPEPTRSPATPPHVLIRRSGRGRGGAGRVRPRRCRCSRGPCADPRSTWLWVALAQTTPDHSDDDHPEHSTSTAYARPGRCSSTA